MKIRGLLLLLTALALVASSCSLEAISEVGEEDPRGDRKENPPVEFNQSDEPASGSDLADVIDEVLPSVVNIRVESLQFDPLTGPQEVQGQGSGVVIEEEGIIITNAHVVQDSTEVSVVFNDEHGRMEGKVLGVAPEKDIAVVRVEAGDLEAIQLGKSESLRLGDDVVALGFPLGLGGPTVTKGIVSALDRNIDVNGGGGGSARLEKLIQTDAAINPGNSGGALIDVSGRLIGINTAAAQAGAAENIGFAIPVDAALPIAEEIINEPPEERAWLGVQIQSIESSAVASQTGLDPDARGALVIGVFPDSAAGTAGIEEGDLIVEVGDRDVRSADDLTAALTKFDPRETIDVVVVRDGEEVTLEAELDQRPASIPVPEE
jgi:S1-C subfamily serine protease